MKKQWKNKEWPEVTFTGSYVKKVDGRYFDLVLRPVTPRKKPKVLTFRSWQDAFDSGWRKVS